MERKKMEGKKEKEGDLREARKRERDGLNRQMKSHDFSWELKSRLRPAGRAETFSIFL